MATTFRGHEPTQHALNVIGVLRNLLAIDGVPKAELRRDLRLE
jgi:hypothetical protein